MREILVNANDEGQRLNKFLMKYLNQAPSSFVYKMLRKKNIVLNDKKASGNEIIKKDDTIKLYLSDETIDKFTRRINETIKVNKNIPIKVLFKNKDILAVHKPSNVLSQKANKDDYSINEAIVSYALEQKLISDEEFKTFKPSVCNRLDRNTSGIILAGISLKGSQMLSEAMKERTSEKYYYTIVSGVFSEKATKKAYIKRDGESFVSQVIDAKDLVKNNMSGYDYIETKFYPISNNGKYTLIKIKLITGKTHQIRAHLKSLGYPVIGDMKYGDKKVNDYFYKKYKLKTHLLHAGEFIYKDIVIKDELPDIFIMICEKEGLKY